MSSKMTECEGFPFFDFFELVMSISKRGQNGGSGRSRLAIDSCKTLNGSMIKQHIVNLKMIFLKNHE